MTALILHQDAEDEIRREAAYYDAKAAGLGLDFLDEVERAFLRIQESPEAWPPARHRTRTLQLERFPHSVRYRAFPDVVWILAVAPQRRRPFYWLKRTRDARHR